MYIRFCLFAPLFFSPVFFYVITFLFLCLFPFSPCLPSLLLFVICLTFSFSLFFFLIIINVVELAQASILRFGRGIWTSKGARLHKKKGHAAKLCRQTYIFSMKSLSFVCS